MGDLSLAPARSSGGGGGVGVEMIKLALYIPPTTFPSLAPASWFGPRIDLAMATDARANANRDGMRRCADCGERKELEDFPKNRNQVSGRTYQCQPCRNAARRGGRAEQRTTRTIAAVATAIAPVIAPAAAVLPSGADRFAVRSVKERLRERAAALS